MTWMPRMRELVDDDIVDALHWGSHEVGVQRDPSWTTTDVAAGQYAGEIIAARLLQQPAFRELLAKAARDLEE